MTVQYGLRCSYWNRLLTSCITGSVIRIRTAIYRGSQNLTSGFDGGYPAIVKGNRRVKVKSKAKVKGISKAKVKVNGPAC